VSVRHAEQGLACGQSMIAHGSRAVWGTYSATRMAAQGPADFFGVNCRRAGTR
jgi:hypothetical protein